VRVAWVHPTWRDLVIERLAADARLRRHFLSHCGPHGVVLALSTGGGATGERALPLICEDEDWDAVGDRIYALVGELEHRELVAVLGAVRGALEAVAGEPGRVGEANALARMALARTAALWTSAHAAVPLSSIDAWLALAARLHPRPWPDYLAVTWAELLPSRASALTDVDGLHAFTDWLTLCEMLTDFSPVALDTLGFGADQENLLRDFVAAVSLDLDGVAEPVRRALDGVIRIMPELTAVVHRVGDEIRRRDRALYWPAGDPVSPWEEDRAQRMAQNTARRVLADL
jgi:hypothetical protein